jgi:subfamily B ATP-binding cassette protein MsbA
LVVAMADGRVVEAGTHAMLLSGEGLYARLVRSQALAIG